MGWGEDEARAGAVVQKRGALGFRLVGRQLWCLCKHLMVSLPPKLTLQPTTALLNSRRHGNLAVFTEHPAGDQNPQTTVVTHWPGPVPAHGVDSAKDCRSNRIFVTHKDGNNYCVDPHRKSPLISIITKKHLIWLSFFLNVALIQVKTVFN